MISITELDPSDWERYKALRLYSLEESPLAFGRTLAEGQARSDAEWKEKLVRARQKETWLYFAEEDGELIGMIGACRQGPEKFQHSIKIVGMYVLPEVRGKGVGKMLIEHLMREVAQDPVVRKIKLIAVTTQTAAIEMYRSEGFREIGIQRAEMHHAGTYYDEILMEKIIRQ